ncbi:magnesium transporter CorA family protein [Parasporobacterium paucivorans]|uniref:Magnesium transporter n=1 Tax=Parasporobacterium paucivorans DSM 15970 TaxID=1122934 RepID=A0A1M6E4B1_9FIRM|nr:CorA family divalent cation transporter [Parasporobacterium paucivorans]SHI80245.1 magnesium transporter [Parasporobacterium paucivorans DSM 15970]
MIYYQMGEKITTISQGEINENIITAGVITLAELESEFVKFGFSEATVIQCKKNERRIHGTIDVYDDYHFGIINGIDARNYLNLQDKIALYIKKNLFIVVIIKDEDESVGAKFREALEHVNKRMLTLEKMISAFLERLISEDYDILEDLEEKIRQLEENISNREINKEFPIDITDIRKHLLILHDFYDQLIILGETLQENENDLFEEEKLRYFRIFTNRVKRLSYDVQMLQEYCSHVKEAYHAQMDNNLNSVMEIFTVVAAIFLPLTLIAGWYGMNFESMPELSWKFGYPMVILISVVVVILALRYFRKRKLF